MPTFCSPRVALDALGLTFAHLISSSSLVATLIDVHPDYGTHTNTAYSGHAIVKRTAGGGLELFFWRVSCTPNDDDPSISVYCTIRLQEDTEEAFRALVGCVQTDKKDWAFPENEGGYSSAPLSRILSHRYA